MGRSTSSKLALAEAIREGLRRAITAGDLEAARGLRYFPGGRVVDEGFFQGFADALAEGVRRELIARGISLLASTDKEVKAARYIGRHSIGHEGVYQATLTAHWPEHAEGILAREFRNHYLRRWAVEMGIKLARPGVLTTYEMELPRGVSAAAIGRAEDLFLRCITDYSINEDLEVLRVDALAKWDE